jgi:V8-like Glu-specific endopeptidase
MPVVGIFRYCTDMKNYFLVLCLVLSTNALAFPIKIQPLGIIPTTFTSGFDFEGTVELSSCSASVIRLEGASDSDKAWVLTNGHCVGSSFIDPGVVKTNTSVFRTMKVFNTDASRSVRLTARKLLYATMTKTDLALYQLDKTFSELLQDHSIDALTLSSTEPSVGTPIQVVSGYWKRGYSCEVEAIVPRLQEHHWEMEQSVRYSRPGCEIIGGTSGSPVIKAGTREVVAVNNTANDDGGKCTMNNPCEVDSAGKKTAVKGYSYAQQTAWVYTCLNSKREIDLNTSGCKLPK